MNHDHDAEPHEASDTLTAPITAEVLRCIAHSLLATATQLDRTDRRAPQVTEPTQSQPHNDPYAF